MYPTDIEAIDHHRLRYGHSSYACNELSLKIFQRERRFASGIDLQRYLNGGSKEGLIIGSAVFQQIADEYATRRRQHPKIKLS
ncbi:hypothetical protein BN2475_1040003 [Paraburkholderia ribeironis]|uniref:Uncharacterized protein n=1 Tax=Paraburkholderia ribeironis TaxID=1247936 RepID=A0A1N7SMA6_9BURK|nr:hypothetical protein [Paraburkholderia ribeironis]SIT48464.1 hypothetical protein BN2475_1040003 [Paraburkholderia ribeironis]